MQVNRLSSINFQTFKSNKSKENKEKGVENLSEFINEMNKKDDAILKLSGTYPNLRASLINQAQYDREKSLRTILKESKNVEHDLYSVETRALAILRFIENGFSSWKHKEAFEKIKGCSGSNCQIDGKFYTLTHSGENYLVTRLYDSTRVMFDKNGKVLEVRQNDFLMRTELFYYNEGKEKPFLYCDGYSEKDGLIEAQRAYYIGSRKSAIRNLKIKNGKKSASEFFDFKQSEKSLVLKSYKSADIKLDLLDKSNNYRYRNLLNGDEYAIKVNQ